MRVSSATFPNSLSGTVSQLTVQIDRLQTQASTGQRIRNPEDDPAAMRNVLDLQNTFQAQGQYSQNVAKLQGSVSGIFSSIQSLKKVSDRASEIATLATSNRSPDELSAYASELDQMIESSLGTANAQSVGVFLFGGTADSSVPFSATRDSSGSITAIAYKGNSTVPSYPIANAVTASVAIPGANTGTTGAHGLLQDSRSGVDVFSHLIELRNILRSGDNSKISGTVVPKLNADETGFIFQLAHLGANQSRLDAAAAQSTNDATQIQQQISSRSDADLANTLVQLNQLQSAYSAALQSGAKILKQSLLDYL